MTSVSPPPAAPVPHPTTTPVAEALGRITLGEPRTHRGLTVFPLLDPSAAAPSYVTLRDALRAGDASITEVSEQGDVNHLRVINNAPLPLFILDGEELIGAKQNRIANISLMIPAKTTTVIPVSCVEQGRWNHVSAAFSESKQTLNAGARGKKMLRMQSSLERGVRDADQGAVWDDVAEISSHLRAASPTGALSDAYAKHEDSIADYEQKLVPDESVEEGQIGALFAIGPMAFGFDLFDTHSTLRTYLPKIVRGYTLDAMTQPIAKKQLDMDFLRKDAAHLLDTVAHAPTSRFKAVALGEDVRIAAPATAGIALTVDDRVVHLAAFRAGEFAEGRPSRRRQRVY